MTSFPKVVFGMTAVICVFCNCSIIIGITLEKVVPRKFANFFEKSRSKGRYKKVLHKFEYHSISLNSTKINR